MNPKLQAALQYAARGWDVIPLHSWDVKTECCTCGNAECGSPAKHPMTRNGLRDGTQDERVIRDWWERRPWGNIGICTGARSGLLVIDVDGQDGEESLWGLQTENAPLPDTPISMTGGGGRHLLFRHPGPEWHLGNRQQLVEKVDVRGDGGYIVAPGSRHRSGRSYEFDAATEALPLADLPQWALVLLRQPRPVEGEAEPRDEGAPAPVGPVLSGCEWLRHCIQDSRTLGEQAWFSMLTLCARLEDGERLAQDWSRNHPGYEREATAKKYRHAAQGPGPHSCAFIRQAAGGNEYCGRCPNWGRVKSPLSLGRVRDFGEPPPERAGETLDGEIHCAPPNDLPEEQEPAPQADLSEQKLLGGLMTGPDVLAVKEVMEILERGDFFAPRRQEVFIAIRDVHDQGFGLGLAEVENRLRETRRLKEAGGPEALRELISLAASSSALAAHAREIKKKSRLRSLGALFADLTQQAHAEGADPDEIERTAGMLLLYAAAPVKGEARTAADADSELIDRLEKGEEQCTIRFGIESLDRVVNGLGRGEVGVICARPGGGKSVLGWQQALWAAEHWGPVWHISLEMTDSELSMRDLAGRTEFDFKELLSARRWEEGGRRKFTKAEIEELRAEAERVRPFKKRIHIETHSGTLSALVRRAHRARLKWGIEAIVLDYGQLVKDDLSNPGSKWEGIGNVARALKNDLAMALNVPAWALAQANRESERNQPTREGGRTQKTGSRKRLLDFVDLAGSSEWEAVAGRIIFLNEHPDKPNPEGAERLFVLADQKKGRHFGKGKVSLILDGPRFRFEEDTDTSAGRSLDETAPPERRGSRYFQQQFPRRGDDDPFWEDRRCPE